MAAAQQIEFKYTPRPQFEAFHARTARWACMVCHRRAGKTVTAIGELSIRALHTKKKNARYAYIAPIYRQAKDVAWQYLKDGLKDIAVRVRESALRVELPNGAWITLYGADNPDALRGLYLDGVVMDEYGDSRPSLWGQVVLPTLADRKGWALFIGTAKGKNHFHQIYERSKTEPGWFSLTLKASESGILEPDELLEMKRQMTDEEWEQEMECNFNAAIRGTYYASIISELELRKQIAPGAAQYDPGLPVKVAADLGRSDSTAFWFWQELPHGFAIIDYYEHQGVHLDHYIAMLKTRPYRYEEIWLPHDAKAETLQTKRSTIEQMLDAGLPCRIVPRLKRQHGIDAVRKILPRCWIDQSACFTGVEALRAYSRSFNERTKSFDDLPKHDWASNGADGFRYLSLVCQDAAQEMPNPARADTYAPQYTLDALFAERDRHLRRDPLRI